MEPNLQYPQKLFMQSVRYEIPAFQRRYVWTQEKQWEPLWYDVEDLAQSIVEKEATEPHFIGAVVLQQMQTATATVERRIVVDGQQRLTTLQLLIDAIRVALEDRNHSKPAKRLSALVANAEEFLDEDPDYSFKVWPTVVDRVALRHALNNKRSVKDQSTSRIVQAHVFFRNQAEQWLARFDGDPEEQDRAASALATAVSRFLEIVVIDLGESDDPHVIFETLNARGTPLLQSDMVKNKILHDTKVGIGDDEGKPTQGETKVWPFGQDEWWSQEIGRGLQRRPRVDVYLNHWLTLRNQAEMKPYDEFNAFDKYSAERMKNGETMEDVALDLASLGKTYREVLEEGSRAELATFLKRRNVMNVGVVTPLLLWLLSANLQPLRLANCLKAIESFLVRRVVCRYSARSYGELFIGLIQRLASAPPDDADRIVVSHLGDQTAQATLWPGDKELREAFFTAPLYQQLTRGRMRMVLEAIEAELRTKMTESWEVPGDLHIEHVMPQMWHQSWPLPKEVAEDEEALANRDRMIQTIGNLTLVTGRLNSSLSNAPWGKKRKTLAEHSVLFLNKRLVNEGPDCWDEAAIRKRAKWLHKRAVRIWPYAGEFEFG